MGQWSNEGFMAHPISYYKTAIQNVFLEAFGQDFALDDNLPQGVLIERLAELFYGMDMDGVEAFARLNLNTMGGILLDTVGQLRGIPRVLGQPQTGVATVTCNSNNFVMFTLPAGTIFTAQNGDTFETADAVTFLNPMADVDIKYTSNGDSNCIVGDTCTVNGYAQIKNIEITSLFNGTENESDLAYRRRLQTSYPAAMGTIEYILGKLLELPTVKNADCLYNDTSSTDGNNIPAYCTEFLVAPIDDINTTSLGVFKSTVASTILNNKVPGSPTFGNTTVTATDAFGSSKTVKFTIPTRIEMKIDVTVSAPETTGRLDLSNIDAIKEDVVNYINSLAIGKDVSYARCIAPLAADQGFDIVSFKMAQRGNIVGADDKVYWRYAQGDTATDMAWKVDLDDTVYYTAGTTFPLVGADIYSDDQLTTSVTTIAVANESVWVSNANFVINPREYAYIEKSNITIGI